MSDHQSENTGHAREIFRHNLPQEEARAKLWAALEAAHSAAPLAGERLALAAAHGRITAAPIHARLSAPHYHSAAMDGYAVLASDTHGASETHPLELRLGEAAFPVHTGDPLPEACDAVIMIEQVQELPESIRIRAAVAARQHVRLVGEDMVATELLLPANHRLRPVDLGALAASGHAEVLCRRRPRAIIIPTGAEIIPVGEEPRTGQIIDSNSVMLRAAIEADGGEAEVTAVIPDEPAALITALRAAVNKNPDLILLLAGSSTGSGDHSARCLRELGIIHTHGVAIRPGHPLIIATIDDVVVFGVPGYPVSAALTHELFIRPLLARWVGAGERKMTEMRANLTRSLVSPMGEDEYVRVRLAKVGERTLAAPLSRGAGVLSSLLRADGVAILPRFQEGAAAGSEIQVHSWRNPQDLAHTALLQGSHDPLLELLAQEISARFPPCRMVSASVGSLGGLVALRRQHAHLAGAHLLHPASGEFNLPYVHQQLPESKLRLVTFVEREQGLILAAGNPKAVQGIADLPRLRFVNRQRGAGTRLLLDELLRSTGLANHPEEAMARIRGYDHEEYTHMAVGTAVASGLADCGLGVRSAALALGLDFLPLAWERYDFIIPATQDEHPAILALLALLQDENFRDRVSQEAGYRGEKMGQIVYDNRNG